MALDSLVNELDGYRAKATAEKVEFRRYQNTVANDAKLSPQGKRELIRDTRNTLKDQVSKYRQQEDAAVAAKMESLQRALITRLGSHSTDLIAMRDAEDRADRLEEEPDALKAFQRAARTDDRSLAHAIIRRANDHGWTKVIDQATQAYPDAAEALRDISTLRRFTTDINQAMEKESAYYVADRD